MSNSDYFEFESQTSSPNRNGGYVLLAMSSFFFAFDLYLIWQFGGFGMSIVGVPLLLAALALINLRLTVRLERDVVVSKLKIFFYKKETVTHISHYKYIRMSFRLPPVSPESIPRKYFHVDLCMNKTPYWRPGDFDFYRYISFLSDVDPEEYFSFVDKIVETTGCELFAGPDLPTKFTTLVKERYGDV